VVGQVFRRGVVFYVGRVFTWTVGFWNSIFSATLRRNS